jgi:antitoxin MazE
MDTRGALVLTRVRKWGNSLGLRIPRSFAAEAGVEDGSAVDLTVVDGELRVRPLKRKRYVLGELLDGVSELNLHGEVPTGRPVGREVW